MHYNLDAYADRQRLIAEAIGVASSNMTDYEAGLAAADAMDDLCRALEPPRTLRAVGGPDEGAGVHCGGNPARPLPEQQPQAGQRRRADYGVAAGGFLTGAPAFCQVF